MTDKEAMKLALEALENIIDAVYVNSELEAIAVKHANIVITALKERLAQPEQEPVAWGVFEGNLHDMFFTQEEAQEMARLKGSHAEVKPLYTISPQRPWAGLTDEEIQTTWDSVMDGAVFTRREVYKAIEAKLKEKNGYAEEKNT